MTSSAARAIMRSESCAGDDPGAMKGRPAIKWLRLDENLVKWGRWGV